MANILKRLQFELVLLLIRLIYFIQSDEIVFKYFQFISQQSPRTFVYSSVSILPFNLYFPNATELSGKYHSHGSKIGIKFNIYLHAAQLQHW